MTGTTLISDIRNEILEPVAGFWSDAELLVHINRAEADYFNRIRGKEADATITTVAGDMDYPLPSNWLSTRAVFFNEVNQSGNDGWHRLEPTNLEKVAQQHPNFLNSQVEQRGVPREYFIWNTRISVLPVPKDTGRSIKMYYKSKAVPLTVASNSLNVDDSLSGAIRAYVLWKAWSKEKEMELAAEQRELYFKYVHDGLRWVKRQSGDQRIRIDLESGIPYTYGSDDPFRLIG